MTTPEHDAHWYDRMYNNRAMVPDFGQYFDRWVRESAAARSQACSTSIAYGAHSTETLDIFPANRPGAPVLVFIHGGYWRFLDKFDHSFMALPFQRAGCTVVVPNYALCPAVTVPDIVALPAIVSVRVPVPASTTLGAIVNDRPLAPRETSWLTVKVLPDPPRVAPEAVQ